MLPLDALACDKEAAVPSVSAESVAINAAGVGVGFGVGVGSNALFTFTVSDMLASSVPFPRLARRTFYAQAR